MGDGEENKRKSVQNRTSDDDTGLPPRQVQALAALLNSPSIVAAAGRVGIHEGTISRWIRDDLKCGCFVRPRKQGRRKQEKNRANPRFDGRGFSVQPDQGGAGLTVSEAKAWTRRKVEALRRR